MSPRGFLFGLGIAAAFIVTAFIVRGNYDAVLAFLNSQTQTAAAAESPSTF